VTGALVLTGSESAGVCSGWGQVPPFFIPLPPPPACPAGFTASSHTREDRCLIGVPGGCLLAEFRLCSQCTMEHEFLGRLVK
jgi:hypothetical protein